MKNKANKKQKEEPSVSVEGEGAATAWLIVRPEPGKEEFFVSIAQAQGFEVYRPITMRERYEPRSRRVMVTTGPLCPGYVFVRHPGGRGETVFSLPGLKPGKLGVLRRALLDVAMKELRSRESDGVIKFFKDSLEANRKKKPVRGARVSTLNGHIDAVVEEPIDANRISLLTGMFKGAAKVTCSLDEVIVH